MNLEPDNLSSDDQSSVITLLTDFGEQDWFTGSMKGVIASIAPSVRLIDITHQVTPGDIKDAALILKCAYRFFPRRTIHVVVVDPGVGTGRKVVVMEGGGYLFLAPDNGVLSYLIDELKEKKVYRVTRKDIFSSDISNTFHGRDIFAPLAGRLALGTRPEDLGPELKNPVVFPVPAAEQISPGRWSAEVIFTDGFGNLVTSVSCREWGKILDFSKVKNANLNCSGQSFPVVMATSYAQVKKGELLAIRGSCDYLELAVNGGSASKKLGLKRAEKFVLEIF